MEAQSRTVFLTGVSSGLGAALAARLIDAGHRVVGTVRTQTAKDVFDRSYKGFGHAIVLDLMDVEAIPEAIRKAESVAGPINVLINNAGYGHEGVLEESDLGDLRAQLEVNIIAPVALIQTVLPGMRARRSGHIINITSMAGLVGFPGLTYYCASKFGLEGLSEALAKELRPLGVFVTAVAPGQFRTSWAGPSLRRSIRRISDYDSHFEPLRSARLEKHGTQPGSPPKAAERILELIESSNPPSRLILGTDAFTLVNQKLRRVAAEIAAHSQLSQSTDYD